MLADADPHARSEGSIGFFRSIFHSLRREVLRIEDFRLVAPNLGIPMHGRTEDQNSIAGAHGVFAGQGRWAVWGPRKSRRRRPKPESFLEHLIQIGELLDV